MKHSVANGEATSLAALTRSPEYGARVIDIREGPAYALQHVPGAVSAPYGRWRATGTPGHR